MRTMENAEYGIVINEISKLKGNKFEKMQELEKGMFSLKIGKERIIFELGKRMNIAYKIETGESEVNFIRKTRKELKGFRFENIFQHNNDRVIVLEFARGEEKKELIFEMFGKGNCILVFNGEVLSCYKREKWSDRETKSKQEYKFPKSNVVLHLKEAISEKYIISCMLRLPLGKKYVKEILGRLRIEEKTPGNEIKEKEIEKIEEEIKKMKKEFSYFGFYKDKELIDYGLIDFSEYSEFEKKKSENFSEIVDEYYNSGVSFEKSEKLKKLESILEEQEKQLIELGKKEEEYRSIGDKIYEKYSEVEKLIQEKGKKEIKIEI